MSSSGGSDPSRLLMLEVLRLAVAGTVNIGTWMSVSDLGTVVQDGSTLRFVVKDLRCRTPDPASLEILKESYVFAGAGVSPVGTPGGGASEHEIRISIGGQP